MEYLFSYDNRLFVKCESIQKQNRMVVHLIKVDDKLYPTEQRKELRLSTAEIFWQFCHYASQNKALIYTALEHSDSTISKAFKDINCCFQELGFPKGCYQGSNLQSKLRDKVTCVKLQAADEQQSVLSSDDRQLFEQNIIVENPNQSVSILSDECLDILPSKASGYRCLYLYGDGGSGKTNFLHLLKQEWDSRKGEVYFCSLSALLDDAIQHPIAPNLHCGTNVCHAAFTGAGCTSHFLRFCSIKQFRAGQACIVLLDGLNELHDRYTSSTYLCYRQIITEIDMLYRAGFNLVITSRSIRDLTLLPFSDCIRTATLSPVLVHDSFLTECGTEEVRMLLEKPLFYKLFRRLNRQGQQLPQTEYEIWNCFHLEACRQETEKPNINSEQSLYIYYILLPLFAHFIEANRAEHLTRIQALRLMEQCSSSVIAQERSQYIISQIISESPQFRISFSQLPYIRFDMLRNLGNFIEYHSQSDSIHFRHQEIREYFAAFHVVRFLKTMHTIPLTLNAIPNFNLKTSIQTMVLSALGLHTRFAGDTGALYQDVFGTSKMLLASPEPKELQSQLSEGVCFVYTAFTFSDHFLLHQFDTHYAVISTFCERIMQCGTFLADYPQMISIAERSALLEAFTSLIMLYRMKHDYQKCREAHEFCIKHLAHGCGEYYLRFINHQRGKALLCYSQDLLNNQAVKSHFYSSSDKSPKELFAESLEILEGCMPCNLTANTFGQLYETPVYWLTENKLLKRDLLKAFRYYETAYRCTTDPQYLLSPIGDDITYTLYRMAAMLIKGYLLIEDGKLKTSNHSFLILHHKKGGLQYAPYQATIQYAEEILSHIEGQRCSHTDFLRGAIQLSKNNIAEAKRFFANDADYLLTRIVLLNQNLTANPEKEKVAIEANIQQLKKAAYQTLSFDRTDASYLLEDAKMIGYPI